MDWQALVANVNDRAAIYDETFPGELDVVMVAASARARLWFSQVEAHGVLATFAGAWPVLGREREGGREYRSLVLGVPVTGEVFTFRGVEVARGAILVVDVIASDIGRQEPRS